MIYARTVAKYIIEARDYSGKPSSKLRCIVALDRMHHVTNIGLVPSRGTC